MINLSRGILVTGALLLLLCQPCESGLKKQGQCPQTHGYPYNKGNFCCKYDVACNGEKLTSSSRCCKDYDTFHCPASKCTRHPQAGMKQIGPCPGNYGYAYNNGQFCCKYGKENTNPYEGERCDGGVISSASTCCQYHAFVPCKHVRCTDDPLVAFGPLPGTQKYISGPILGVSHPQSTWTPYLTCPFKKRVTGFRLQLDKEKGDKDDTGVNGIQFQCEGGTVSDKRKYYWGTWTRWTSCEPGAYITQLDLKATQSVTGPGDDYGATNVMAVCSGDEYILGEGLPEGRWTGFEACPSYYYICGGRVQRGGMRTPLDATGLNRIQLACCHASDLGKKDSAKKESNFATQFKAVEDNVREEMSEVLN